MNTTKGSVIFMSLCGASWTKKWGTFIVHKTCLWHSVTNGFISLNSECEQNQNLYQS